MPMGYLAMMVAMIPEWLGMVIQMNELDVAGIPQPIARTHQSGQPAAPTVGIMEARRCSGIRLSWLPGDSYVFPTGSCGLAEDPSRSSRVR